MDEKIIGTTCTECSYVVTKEDLNKYLKYDPEQIFRWECPSCGHSEVQKSSRRWDNNYDNIDKQMIKCTDPSDCPHLTLDEYYEVVKMNHYLVWVIDDHGDTCQYLKERFEIKIQAPKAKNEPWAVKNTLLETT